ncbi:MAG: hypothetical protein MUC48_27555 [Leptolyngbya sp. Prado105]|nr:hypothetical protein [Leptolyngbya sp. Prado105]
MSRRYQITTLANQDLEEILRQIAETSSARSSRPIFEPLHPKTSQHRQLPKSWQTSKRMGRELSKFDSG